MNRRTYSFLRDARRLSPAWAFVAFGLAGILFSVRLRAQPPTVPPPDPAVISSPTVFWALSNEEKAKPHRVRFDMLVYYYDPIWQLVWGECESKGAFLPVRGEPLPIEPGQRVRLEGVVFPERGILRNEVTVTILERDALPTPISSRGGIADSARLNAQWVTVEGYVCRQREVDRNHIEYGVLVENWLVTVRVLVDAAVPMPELFHTLARFNGVYIGDHDAGQTLRSINLWVPRLSDVTPLGELDNDARFKRPRTPIDRVERAKGNDWVRVVGEVREFLPGRSLTLRDDSGQISVNTPQPAKIEPGDGVELVGRAVGDGLSPRLIDPLFRLLPRKSQAPAADGRKPPPQANLRVVDQIMALPLGEIAQGYPVTLKGVVTWSDPRTPFFYFQDASGGICVHYEKPALPPAASEAIEIKGRTVPGRFAPEIEMLERAAFGTMTKPAARPVTLEQAMIGADEAKLVQIRGYLRKAEPDNGWTRMDFTTASGEFSAYAPLDDHYATLTGAIVQVVGVCSATADEQRQMTGLRLWVPDKESVVVEEPPPRDPFSAPRFTITGLKQFSGVGAFNRRVVVSGSLISQTPGSHLVIQEKESGLIVYSRETPPLKIGAAVEVAGLPGREGSRFVLREARVRPAPPGADVAPLTLDRCDEPQPRLDSQLVRVEALLTQAAPQNRGVRLTLQAGGSNFDAVLGAPQTWEVPEPGSRLELTGVYLLEYGANRQPRGFRLELRGPSDVRVLAKPAWWTAERAVGVAGGLAVCTLLGIVWVAVLRRRVQDQTEQILAQKDKEVRMQADLERATRLDSLGVLAGGIAHDFNNLLTAIRGNLELIQLEPKAMEVVGEQVGEAERAARRATDVTQQLLTFSKGGDPVRAAADLAEVVKEAAGFARHGSSVRIEFEKAKDLPPANIDAGQISRVVHNLVLNAVQALAAGGVVRLTLSAGEIEARRIPGLGAGGYLQLSIADNGPGIAPDRLPRIFDPYFTTKAKGSGLGLATCHSIVKKHAGHIEVESRLGVGTTFRIWLPAARSAVVATARTRSPIPDARARVLFMDDDDTIRGLARTFLARAGHDGTFANDGAEAVAAYREARGAGHGFDIVILDLTVPGGMGGKETLEALLKIDPTVRAIASSGYSSDPVMANHRAYGFTAVLPKPYDLDTFARTIAKARAEEKPEP